DSFHPAPTPPTQAPTPRPTSTAYRLLQNELAYGRKIVAMPCRAHFAQLLHSHSVLSPFFLLGLAPGLPLIGHSRNFNHTFPFLGRLRAPRSGICVCLVNPLGHQPDVLRRFALSLDRVGINLTAIPRRQALLRLMHVFNLYLQQP